MSLDMNTISTGDLQDPGLQFLLFSDYFSGIFLHNIVFENARKGCSQLAWESHRLFSAGRSMPLKGASALHKAPPKFGQIYFCTVCLRCTAQQHGCAQKQTSPMAKAPSWAWHNPPPGVQVNLRTPLSWLEEHCKLCLIFWQVSWSDKSAGHFFSAHPVLLLGTELRNTVDVSKGVNHLKLFGNKMWSSAHLQNVLAGHHLVVVKNSRGKLPGYGMCQGMLLLFLGGLWSEARADALLGSAQQIDVLGLWF